MQARLTVRQPLRIAIGLIGILLCLSSSPRAAPGDPTVDTEGFSMTISGGVSLGVYESGVNWAIIELLRDQHRRSGKRSYGLSGVTGASAGSINALLTAIRYCEALNEPERPSLVDNEFYRMWDVGLEEMLPRELAHEGIDIGLLSGTSAVLSDALLTRSPFAGRLEALATSTSRSAWEPGCAVDIAMVVSRTVPKPLKLPVSPVSRQVAVQRFVIPLIARVRGGEEGGRPRLVFENHLAYARGARGTQYLLLPETGGEVDFDVVVRAVLASSAFPVAFGRVQLQYCAPDSSEVPPAILTGHCPPGHHLRSGYFVDGGIFDNIPVGTAVELASLERADETAPGSFIYLDPGNTSEELAMAVRPRDTGSNALGAQANLLVMTLSTLRKQKLSADLRRDFAANREDRPNPDLLVSARSNAIVGSYLGGFAAFVDRSFFHHDYAAGVFDGILNVAQYVCEARAESPLGQLGCPEGVFGMFDLIAARLGLGTDSRTFRCVRADFCGENEIVAELVWKHRVEAVSGPSGQQRCSEPGRPPKSRFVRPQALAVSEVVCETRPRDFGSFVRALDAERRGPERSIRAPWSFGPTLEYIIANDDGGWVWGFADHALRRMQEIEESDSGGHANFLGALRAVLPLSDPYTVDTESFSKRVLYDVLVPETVGLDGFQSGVFAAWELPRLEPSGGLCLRAPGALRIDRLCGRVGATLGLELHGRRVENDNERHNSMTGYLGLGVGRRGRYVFSSYGARYRRSLDYLPWTERREGEKWYDNYELYVQLFGDKLTLSLGFREDFGSLGENNVSVRFAISDLDRFARIAFR